MVAGIFREHEIFTGTCLGVTDLIPTGAVENIGLKQILKADYPLGLDTVKDFREGFRKKIETVMKQDGYEEGPWMAKHAAVYWKVWDEFSPKFVIVKRNYESVINSNTKSGMAGIRGEQLKAAYNLNLHEMDCVHDKFGSPVIHSDKVIQGDFSEVEKAFDYCGLEFEIDRAETVVRPEHWHY
jgi:hypothetical protein